MIKKKKIYITAAEPTLEFKTPTKGSDTAHCFDVFVGEDFTILPNEIKKVKTGFKLQLPKECAALIRERSSTITKHDINVEAGDIDSDYRGHVWVVFYRKPGVGFINALRYAWSKTSGEAKHKAYIKLVENDTEDVSIITQMFRDIYFTGIPGLWRTVNVVKETFKYWWRRNKAVKFEQGTRLAQMEIVEVLPAEISETNVLTSTNRGSGGFGSTGQSTIAKKPNKERKPRNKPKKTEKKIQQTEPKTQEER